MPEPILLFRGFPQPPLEALISNPQALGDLQAVANLSSEKVNNIQKALASASGYLAPKNVRKIIQKQVGDANVAESIQNVRNNLRAFPPSEIISVLRKTKSEGNAVWATDELLQKLERQLAKLMQRHHAIDRYEKAERLSALTGQRLESVDLVCDLRPIFDANRQGIEGMMPYTRLHLITTGANGLPVQFEAELSWEQVLDLAEKSRMAGEKLLVLSKFIKANIAGGIPELPLTREPRERERDA